MIAAISLDRLVAAAELLTRVDRKYLLPAALLPTVLARLPHDTRALEIDGRRDFAYRSLYFDTDRLDCYLGAAHRRRRRFKVRIRSYLDSGTDFLEVKTRGSRGETIKNRLVYDASPALLKQVLVTAGVTADEHAFRPVLSTDYRRQTLYLPSTGSRVTVDRELTWSLPDGPEVRVPDHLIVETKSAGAASEMDRVLWALGHRPCSLSKYATGLAALRPELPANRWHPVLKRHFSPQRTAHETA
ncbi:polyphosphate polymerase domain-containing protein [Actinoplanes sp. L3-i22]|uniref:polyphosphate polymerase domain-containing protein n=1 Tax=Actinoplanes sp. L3-i22 TaxID=2836373 RepID=UPI001C7692E3|nr:polyphosphate polymerase domain-containing protein [Actinoplanes sp. L3-i22]BCY12388.1 VTC domain-containing protein [Actinoplanes sp. L3-i22]